MGVPEAASFFRMTPREVCLLLLSARAQADREWRSIVLSARLMALAVHDPAHLPALPPSPSPCDMTADEMKRRLLSLPREEDFHDP